MLSKTKFIFYKPERYNFFAHRQRFAFLLLARSSTRLCFEHEIYFNKESIAATVNAN
jgi:hypothetical protein